MKIGLRADRILPQASAWLKNKKELVLSVLALAIKNQF